MNLEEKEKIEINWWRDNQLEVSTEFTRQNFLNKTQEAGHFSYKIIKNRQRIRGKSNVLEIGAGQGWASCFLKKFFLPKAHFTVTDISPFAIEAIKHWETLYHLKIDKAYAAKSYELEEPDEQFDLIFCYAAAHHFVEYEKTLIELKRVLKPKGHILFLYEPTCSKLFYPLYYKYVNSVPHSTPEDVLVPSEIAEICEKLQLDYLNIYDAHQSINRSIPVMIYMKFLNTFSFLQKSLPSSSDLIITKKD